MRPLAGAGAISPTLKWTKYSVAESDFTATAANESLTLFSLPALGVIHGVIIKHSTPFTGGAAADFTLEVGISGTETKYAGAFDVFQAAGNTVFQISSTVGMENYGAATNILVTGRCATDDVADVTAGAAEIWVLTSEPTA
jgi:hypothetical protein